jgi:uncharacterized protein (UPF0335 family)
MAKRAKDEEGASAGTNVPDGEKILGFIERVENLEADIASETGEFMARVKVIKGDIKEVLKEAKESGLNKKALQAKLKERKHLAKAKEAGDELEGEASDAYAAYSAALDKIAA